MTAISKSDLMILNRLIAHEAAPRERKFFRDSEDQIRMYMKRQPTIMSGQETMKDLEASVSKMLRALSDEECSEIKRRHAHTEMKRERYMNILKDIIAKHGRYSDLQQYAPNLLKIL